MTEASAAASEGMVGATHAPTMTAALLLVSAACLAGESVDALRVPVSARDASLGNIAALSSGPEALFLSPAGIAQLPRSAATLSHARLSPEASLSATGAVVPLGEAGSAGRLGVSGIALTQSRLEGRDAAGVPTGSFGAGEWVVGLAYARSLGGGRHAASVGAALKHARQRIAEREAGAYAVDLGFQKGGIGPGLFVAASAQNLGWGPRLGEEAGRLPLAFSAGLGVLVRETLTLQLGATRRPHAGLTTVAAGAELWLASAFSLRSAFWSRFERSPALAAAAPARDPLGRMGFGAGWRLRGGDVRLDYAFAPQAADLAAASRFTLSVVFGARERWERPSDLRDAPAPVGSRRRRVERPALETPMLLW